MKNDSITVEYQIRVPAPVLSTGNHACAEGALAVGCRFFGGYPITPSSEVAELMSRRLPQVDGTFLQMEDEIASIMACLGASFAGVKAMTATSGPGLSLMAESLGLAVMMEVSYKRCLWPQTASLIREETLFTFMRPVGAIKNDFIRDLSSSSSYSCSSSICLAVSSSNSIFRVRGRARRRGRFYAALFPGIIFEDGIAFAHDLDHLFATQQPVDDSCQIPEARSGEE